MAEFEKVAEIEKNSQENVEKQFEAAVQERRTAAKELVDQGTDYPKIKKALKDGHISKKQYDKMPDGLLLGIIKKGGNKKTKVKK